MIYDTKKKIKNFAEGTKNRKTIYKSFIHKEWLK